MAIYLDCNATTPIEQPVLETVLKYMAEEFGNAGSRTHDFGLRAKKAVERARAQVADVVRAEKEEVIFTSGATESNNLAIFGLEAYGVEAGKNHIISTSIEHKAVLEPLEVLARRGFEITLVPPNRDGRINPDAVINALRADTLFVSVMQVNNETGVIQPVGMIADALLNHSAFFHVDAAQGFGKDIDVLQHQRIDLISISGHKVYAPKGIGALITRRRGRKKLPLQPLMYGGGQERGLRPGTLPVPLIAGLGVASEMAAHQAKPRAAACLKYKKTVVEALETLNPIFNGDPIHTLPHVLNFSLPGIDSEAMMVALKELIAISNGSACTSQSYTPSHVLQSMGLDAQRVQGAVRISWNHNTVGPNWNEIVRVIQRIM